MGGRPKALLQFKGRTFLERILAAISEAGIPATAVVVGHHRKEITAAFPLLSPVFNPDYEKGMSTSVQAGIRALPPGVTGAGVFLVDQPLIDAATIAILAAALRPGGIVLPVHAGRRGHPAFFASDLFAEILTLGPDEGLNVVVRRNPERVLEVDAVDSNVLEDIDTPEQLEKLLQQRE